MAFDPSSDFFLIDGKEAVTFLSKRNTGDLSKGVSNAFRQALDVREAERSGGKYQAGDIVWYVHQSEVTPWVPKPADRLTDITGQTFTVLSSEFTALITTYRLVTRNLAVANDLRDLLDHQRPTYSQDRSGRRVLSYTTLSANVPCSVRLDSQEKVEERGMVGLLGKYTIRVSQQLTFRTDDRVSVGGEPFRVLAYSEGNLIDTLPFLSAEKAL